MMASLTTFFVSYFGYTDLQILQPYNKKTKSRTILQLYNLTNLQPYYLRERVRRKNRNRFYGDKNLPPFLLKIVSLMAETNFTLGPISKTNTFPL